MSLNNCLVKHICRLPTHPAQKRLFSNYKLKYALENKTLRTFQATEESTSCFCTFVLPSNRDKVFHHFPDQIYMFAAELE